MFQTNPNQLSNNVIMRITMYIYIEHFGDMNSDLVKNKIIHIRNDSELFDKYLSNEKRTI